MAYMAQPLESSRLLTLIRHDEATTRADLQSELGWSRVTVGKRLDELMKLGLIEDSGMNLSTGGRPSSSFQVRKDYGVLLAIDMGGEQAHLAVTDFVGHTLVELVQTTTIDDGPEVVFRWVKHQFRRMLKHLGVPESEVRGIGIGVPGPVDTDRGTIVHPPIMPGWHGVCVPEYFRDIGHDVPIVVDRDANVLALGEYQTWRHVTQDLLVLKVGEGITTSAILAGRIYRGANGLAGELGHLRVDQGRQCRCGRFGCLESIVGGWSIRERLAEVGWNLSSSVQVAELAQRGDSRTIDLLGQAGEHLGAALSGPVCTLNPSTILVTGSLAEAGDLFMTPFRQSLQRAVPDYVSNTLSIVRSRIGESAGILGAALAAQDRATDSQELTRMLASTTRD